MQYDAIRSGQVEQILSLLQQKPDGTEGILSKDQLRNSKNMFIAGITLLPGLLLTVVYQRKQPIL